MRKMHAAEEGAPAVAEAEKEEEMEKILSPASKPYRHPAALGGAWDNDKKAIVYKK
jgi:hypothetical protein